MGTILTAEGWAPAEVFVKLFPHNEKKGPGPQKGECEKRPSTRLKTSHKGRKDPPIRFFFYDAHKVYYIARPGCGRHMSESDYKMHDNFKNYLSHNYIKIHSRMHPIELFL